MANGKSGGEYASGHYASNTGEAWTNQAKHKNKLGLFRRQARRHGMQTEAWGQEPERDSHPSFKGITSAMNPGQKGKGARGFEFSNLQPRGGRR